MLEEGGPRMVLCDRLRRDTGGGDAERASRREVVRAPIKPSLVTWARERAGLERADLTSRFPQLMAWEKDGVQPPPLAQLEDFARFVHVPFGYLFLSKPPEEPIPIDDFRSPAAKSRRPSPDLLDMLYDTQGRQDWYREFALRRHLPKARFVGSLTTGTPVPEAAAAMARELDFSVDARDACRTWEEALRLLIDRAERAGVLVMVSVVVKNNTHRRLKPEEFRGFALSDDYAPLVFVNGADVKANLMFALAHELAHLWLGVSALSDDSAATVGKNRCKEEVWCNRVAAELLAPLNEVRAAYTPGGAPGRMLRQRYVGGVSRKFLPGGAQGKMLRQLSGRFKVSTLVILRRLLDLGAFDRTRFDAAWEAEFGRLLKLESRKPKQNGGRGFHHTRMSRVGWRFAQALVTDTLEGETLYHHAFRLLGAVTTRSFDNIVRKVGATPPPRREL